MPAAERRRRAWLDWATVLERWLGVRREDRRDASVGFLLLLLMMAGHAMLEAARDALFLASLPPSLLPWAYLAMAALTLLAAQVNRAVLVRYSRAWALATTLGLSAVGTACFWLLSSLSASASTLVAFYVWTGLVATVVVVQFWLQLSDVLDIGQAKRVYAWIGAGGLVGATLGSAFATLLLTTYDARTLPIAAASVYGLSALLPFLFSRKKQRRSTRGNRALRFNDPEPTRASALQLLLRDAYLRRVLLLVLTSTLVVTGVDYVFKFVVHQQIPAAELGPFFARYYTLLNLVALLVQVVVAPRLLRNAGVNRALFVMPALLLIAAGSFVFSGGLLTAILLKGGDGATRHSINRTATEILYVPLSASVRDRFKTFSDAVGQRGGQALASLLILASVAAGVHAEAIGWALLVLSAVWLLCILGLQTHYLELFRSYLRRGTVDTRADVPELDLRTLEALLATLSSEDDAEVIAALDMFHAYDRSNLVPALILYHPSRAVVLRAFELFAQTPRVDVQPLTARLLSHPDHEIRAAALRMYSLQRPDERLLRTRLGDASPAVRATALVGLVAAGFVPADKAEGLLREVVSGNSPEARQALALSLRLLPADQFSWVALSLLRLGEPGLASAVAASLAVNATDVRLIPALLELLSLRETRGLARTALIRMGEPALQALEAALTDPSVRRGVRRHLPRTISRFSGQRPVDILAAFLLREKDDVLTFKVLRGLGRLRENDATLVVDDARMLQEAQRWLERAYTRLGWRVIIERCKRPACAEPRSAWDLLCALLREQEAHAVERVFRLLHIVSPQEEFSIMHAGLRSPEPKIRASSRELLISLVPDALRSGLLAIVDELPPEERLRTGASFFQPELYEEWRAMAADNDANAEESFAGFYERALSAMLLDESKVLRSVVRYHADALGLCAERAPEARPSALEAPEEAAGFPLFARRGVSHG